jgi:hypothetical protein
MTTFFYWVLFTALYKEKNVQPKIFGAKELGLTRKAEPETHQESQETAKPTKRDGPTRRVETNKSLGQQE